MMSADDVQPTLSDVIARLAADLAVRDGVPVEVVLLRASGRATLTNDTAEVRHP